MAKKKKRRANAESDSDTGEWISHDPYEWIPVLRAESPAFEEIARLIDDDERIVDHIDEEGRVFLKSYPRSHMGKLVNVCLILDLAGRDMRRANQEPDLTPSFPPVFVTILRS